MEEWLAAPPPWLPAALLSVDLLDLFMIYVTLAFVASIALRWRFYSSIYRIATYFAKECPNVFKLLDRHLPLLMQNGIVPLLTAYGAVFLLYFLYTRLLFPSCSLTVADFAGRPGMLTGVLALWAVMIAVDIILILDIGKIDEAASERDLRFAEYWLGSRLTRGLDILGKWNPIRAYADFQTQLALRDFNHLFRYSLGWVLTQTVLRALLVVVMFGYYAWNR